MLQEYSISDLLAVPPQHIPYYAGTFEDTEDTDVEWPHRHSFYSLVWFTQGSGFYVIDFQEYVIKPNRIFIVNPKQVHNWDYSENSEGYILIVDTTLGTELSIDFQFPYIDLDNATKLFLEPIFKKLISEYEIHNEIRIDIQYLYKQIKLYAKENNTISVTANPIFKKFKLSILNNLNKNQSIEDYARKLAISADELNILSKQISGVSAKQYSLDLKITEAKRLLIYSDQNINEISNQIGIEDSSYFARIFKKKTTLSPTNFLRKYRKHI